MKRLLNYYCIAFTPILGISFIVLFSFSCTDRRIACEGRDDCPDGLICQDNFCIQPIADACEGFECREYEVCYPHSEQTEM